MSLANTPNTLSDSLSQSEVWGLISAEHKDSKTFLLQVQPDFSKILISGNVPPFPGHGKYEGSPHWPSLHETYVNKATGDVVCASKTSDISYFLDVSSQVYIEIEPDTCIKIDSKNDVLIMSKDSETGEDSLSVVSWDNFYKNYNLSVLPYKDPEVIFNDFISDFEILLNSLSSGKRDENLLHSVEAKIASLSTIKLQSPDLIGKFVMGQAPILSKLKEVLDFIEEDYKKIDPRTMLVTQKVITKYLNLFRKDVVRTKTSIDRSISITDQLEWAQSFQIDKKEAFHPHPHYQRLKSYFLDEARDLEVKTIPELFFSGKIVVNGDIDYKGIISGLKTRYIEQFGEYPEELLKNNFNHSTITYNIGTLFSGKGDMNYQIIDDDEVEISSEIEEFLDLWIHYNFSKRYDFARINMEYAQRYIQEEEYSTFYSLYVGGSNLMRKKVSDFLKIPYLSREKGEEISEVNIGRTIEKTSKQFSKTLVEALTKTE